MILGCPLLLFFSAVLKGTRCSFAFAASIGVGNQCFKPVLYAIPRSTLEGMIRKRKTVAMWRRRAK